MSNWLSDVHEKGQTLNDIPAASASAVESRRDSCEDQKKSKSLNKRTGRDSEDSRREGESDDDLLSETATEVAKDLKNHMTGGADVMAMDGLIVQTMSLVWKVGVCDYGENFITIYRW